MITSIHALRGLAALAVVLAHTHYQFFGAVSSQFQGVSIFFVISGFIVAYITEQGTSGFLLRRAVRILPVYWCVTALALVWYSLGQFDWISVLLNDPAQGLRQLQSLMGTPGIAERLARSAVLAPYREGQGGYTVFLGVGWTLCIEGLYYLLFAAFAAAGRVTAMWTVSAFFIGCNAARVFAGADGIIGFYGQLDSLYIPMGFGVYWLWKKASAAKLESKQVKFASAVVGGALLLVNGAAWNTSPMAVVLPPMAVFSALMLHSSGVRFQSKWLVFLGNISYSLYLVHTVVLTTFERYEPAHPVLDPKTFSGMALAVLASCGAAWLMHIGIEKPFIRLGKKFTEGKPPNGHPATT